MIHHLLRRCANSTLVRYIQANHVRCSSRTTRNKQHTTGDEEKYTLVYRFSYIAPVRGLARFKIYQTAAMFAVLPFVRQAVDSGQLELDYVTPMSMAAVLALGTLYYISNITRKLACIVSIHDDKETIRIARMTFWGNRRNIIVPIEHIVPLSEVGRSSTDVYTDLKTFDGTVKLYLPLKYGVISDHEHFQHIFGKLS